MYQQIQMYQKIRQEHMSRNKHNSVDEMISSKSLFRETIGYCDIYGAPFVK